MTISIELSDQLAARLAAAGIPAEEAGRYAVAALLDIVDRAEKDASEVHAWWDSLSDEHRSNEARKTEQSLAQGDAGRVRSAADVYARLRSRHSDA
jgi:hypothetical protein